MTINLIAYTSSLDQLASSAQDHQKLLNELEIQFSVKYYKHTDLAKIPKDQFSVLFIATGGVEELIAQDVEELPRPIVLLADGLQNSLAAALEASTWLRERGLKNEILHGDIQQIKERILNLAINFHAQQRLKQQRIGVLGAPAPWVIASSVDYYLAKQRWGIEFVNIPLTRIYDTFDKISEDDVSTLCTHFISTAYACNGSTPTALINSMRFYKAVKQICEEEGLTAVTLNCYKTLKDIGVTGCLANALLNDEGIIAGCEGDMQTIFTLVMIKALTGEVGFMCNPSEVDVKENKIVMGHCSIGTKQTSHFVLRNHFLTKNAISIQGILPLGEFTILKCGGECLDKYFVSSGYILQNTEKELSSRTEVLFKMNEDASYFLRNPLSNHHVMIRGNHEGLIQSFLETYSCKRVR